MSNRAQRRAAARQEQRENAEMMASGYFQAKVREAAIKQKKLTQLERNGITAEDLAKNYKLGYNAALKWNSEYLQPFFYSAIAIAAKRTLKFGQERTLRLMHCVQQVMLEEIAKEDILERAKEETGIDVKAWYESCEIF